MSEYWKSTPKYWCKHCSAYIRDTPFERRQHESTAKHQNNLKRFLRDIQNDHERGERDKQKAKAEVDRLNRITGGGSLGPDGATPQNLPPTSARPPQRDKIGPRTAEDQKRQWQQLADMGIQVPEHARANMAMVGDWTTLPQQKFPDLPEESLSVGVRKRKLEDDEDDDVASKSLSKTKVWGKSVKALPGDSQDDLDDLLSTSISLKSEKAQTSSILPKCESLSSGSTTAVQDLSRKQRPTTTVNDKSDDQIPPPSEGGETAPRTLPGITTADLVKDEAADDDGHHPALENIPESNPAPVFKKRKPKANPVKS